VIKKGDAMIKTVPVNLYLSFDDINDDVVNKVMNSNLPFDIVYLEVEVECYLDYSHVGQVFCHEFEILDLIAKVGAEGVVYEVSEEESLQLVDRLTLEGLEKEVYKLLNNYETFRG